MGKITFMGAGSTVFAKNVIGDSMLAPALQDFEYALYDIDPERLEESYIMVSLLNKNINEGRAKITKHLGVEQRKDALRGADFVINAIQVGGYDPCTIMDFEKVRPSSDYCRHAWHRRHIPCAPYDSRA